MFKSVFRSPSLWLGFGLGTLAGILLSSGLKFSDQDSARFLGAILGSLIAVCSAVSLHFLKEESETKNRRERLRTLLLQAKGYLVGLPKEIDEKNFALLTGGLDVVGKYLNRCKRYCEAHETDDFVISTVGNHFEHIEGERFSVLVNEDDEYPPEVRELIREQVIEFVGYIEDCLGFFPKGRKR